MLSNDEENRRVVKRDYGERLRIRQLLSNYELHITAEKKWKGQKDIKDNKIDETIVVIRLD